MLIYLELFFETVVLYDNVRIKYHNVTNVHGFISYCRNNLPVRAIMFYCKNHYRDGSGNYCGYWSLKNGFLLNN
jgi:hypothetical protein